jgi:hypothetical protein
MVIMVNININTNAVRTSESVTSIVVNLPDSVRASDSVAWR